jgi:hypothetical protein
MREVADRAIVAHDRREPFSVVEHRAVLDRRAITDLNAGPIAPQHRARPDGGFGTDRDTTDDDRLRVHERRGVDDRLDVAQRVDGHGQVS